jgi:hypothetical protein
MRFIIWYISNSVLNLKFKHHHCYSLHLECVKKMTRGYFSICCSNDKIFLSGWRLPNEIFDLLTGENKESKIFKENIPRLVLK